MNVRRQIYDRLKITSLDCTNNAVWYSSQTFPGAHARTLASAHTLSKHEFAITHWIIPTHILVQRSISGFEVLGR